MRAMNEPRIAEIARKRYARVWPGSGRKLTLYTTNHLLRDRYPGAIGLKTGYTNPAGFCLVAIVQRGSRRIGVILLGSQGLLLRRAPHRPRGGADGRAARRRPERRRSSASMRLTVDPACERREARNWTRRRDEFAAVAGPWTCVPPAARSASTRVRSHARVGAGGAHVRVACEAHHDHSSRPRAQAPLASRHAAGRCARRRDAPTAAPGSAQRSCSDAARQPSSSHRRREQPQADAFDASIDVTTASCAARVRAVPAGSRHTIDRRPSDGHALHAQEAHRRQGLRARVRPRRDPGGALRRRRPRRARTPASRSSTSSPTSARRSGTSTRRPRRSTSCCRAPGARSSTTRSSTLGPMDALRVAPTVTRAFEAGPDGLELLAFGPRHKGDGETIQGWWERLATRTDRPRVT